LEQEASSDAAQSASTADALEELAQMIESADGARAGQGDSEGAPGNAAGSEGGSQGGDGSEGASSTEGNNASGTQSGAQGSAGEQSTAEEQSTGSVESLVAAGDAVSLRRSESLDPGALRPADNPGRATDRRSVPYVHYGAAGAGGEQASDPLTIPWRLRNIIERYFSPP
jgi:hypothetical protein